MDPETRRDKSLDLNTDASINLINTTCHDCVCDVNLPAPGVPHLSGKTITELKSGVFGRKELHQVRPDRHHSHGDGAQSGDAACAGSAGGPAHTGAEKKGNATLTLWWRR